MTGTYNGWLQLLSFAVAVIASYVALDLGARVASSSKQTARYWLIGGAVSMGTGIWSMHFIGMLAFQLPIQMGYDVSLTLLSMLVAILASGFALFTINRDVLSVRRLLTSGLLMGAGIATMHYVGMAAMRMSPAIDYDPLLFLLSIVVAVGASVAALWITFNLRSSGVAHVGRKRMAAAVVMGIAIVGMHYTGMAAANFAPNSICYGNPEQIGSLWMAAAIAGCTLLFLTATMLISVFDARLASSTAKLANSLLSANEALHRTNAELLDMKVAAESASRAKSDFLANVSHELRTPLTLILAPLEQMLNAGEQPPATRAQLERVQRNALLLLNRVNDILDFSKAEADKFVVHWEAVNLAKLIAAMVDDAQPVAETKSCALTCTVDPALSAVALDRAHFEKIVLNFLSNALKFTPAGGTIVVEAATIEGGMFEFAVTDSGIGIAADQLPRLFERFHQVDNSATREHGGTGIGLALVRELAHLMGGTAGAESAPGKGSSFFVRLPIGADRLDGLASAGAPVHGNAPTVSEAMLRKVRLREGGQAAAGEAAPVNAALPVVLVADDNPDMLAYISELLRPECQVLTAVDGNEAWSVLQRQRVDVIVSDVMMPELDGLALTAKVKASPNFSHIPVILVTARGGADASVSGLDTGADDYIAKPFSTAELRARVRSALRMVQVQAELREKSREAGMAMVANGILHNLGNILNGVTVSSGLIEEKLQRSKIPSLQKVAELLQKHAANLPAFIADDSRGQVLPAYITQLSAHLEAELSSLTKEVENLRSCADHVVGVIATQQQFAHTTKSITEMVSIDDLMEKSLRLSRSAFEMRGVDVISTLDCGVDVAADTHKVIQILLNLLGNARHAVAGRAEGDKRVWLRTSVEGDVVRMEVRDNGIGIAAEHLPLMFNQGFTTKKDGHGLGLHSSANWARELGGALRCRSEGLGAGATFVLELPLHRTIDAAEAETAVC